VGVVLGVGVGGGVPVGVGAATIGTVPLGESTKLFNEPFQIAHWDSVASSLMWLGTTAGTCTVSPTVLAIAGRAGEVKEFAETVPFRSDWMAACSAPGSEANWMDPPLKSAMHCSLLNWLVASGVPRATTYTGIPLSRMFGSALWAAVRVPPGSGSGRMPRSPAGPFCENPPPVQGSASAESMPSVRKMILYSRQLADGSFKD